MNNTAPKRIFATLAIGFRGTVAVQSLPVCFDTGIPPTVKELSSEPDMGNRPGVSVQSQFNTIFSVLECQKIVIKRKYYIYILLELSPISITEHLK